MDHLSITTRNGHRVEAVFSNAADGNMDTRFGEQTEVYNNRDQLYSQLGLSALNVTWMRANGGETLHDTAAAAEADLNHGRGVICDSLVTTDYEHGLALFPADCIPMVIHDSKIAVVALAHVGRTGAQANIHLKTIQHLQEVYGSDSADLGFYLGPHIQKPSYKYDALDEHITSNPDWQPHIHRQNGHFLLDLAGFVKAGLVDGGIAPEQIQEMGADTGDGSGQYYSHRHSQLTGSPQGRNGVVVTIRKN